VAEADPPFAAELAQRPWLRKVIPQMLRVVTYVCRVPSNFVTRTERCPECHRDSIVVTVEQLLTARGEVIASIVIARALCTTEGCRAPSA